MNENPFIKRENIHLNSLEAKNRLTYNSKDKGVDINITFI